MSPIFSLSHPESVWLTGASVCPAAIDRVPPDPRRCAERRRHFAGIAPGRALATLLILFCGIGTVIAAGAGSLSIDLSRQQIGAPPQDFEFWRAGVADAGHWKVVREASTDSGRSIEQSGADRAARSSLAIYARASVLNARVRARFNLIDGSMPSAGIALRVTSPDDYYLVRASALEQRLSVLHVVHGAPEEIAGVDAEIAQSHWQSLEVVTNGNSFSVSLNDQWALTAFDYGKLAGGQFGLWTERDDVTRFDQIEMAPLT